MGSVTAHAPANCARQEAANCGGDRKNVLHPSEMAVKEKRNAIGFAMAEKAAEAEAEARGAKETKERKKDQLEEFAMSADAQKKYKEDLEKHRGGAKGEK